MKQIDKTTSDQEKPRKLTKKHQKRQINIKTTYYLSPTTYYLPPTTWDHPIYIIKIKLVAKPEKKDWMACTVL